MSNQTATVASVSTYVVHAEISRFYSYGSDVWCWDYTVEATSKHEAAQLGREQAEIEAWGNGSAKWPFEVYTNGVDSV